MLAIMPARAQSVYPSKPITLVVAFAPGGATDTAARIVAKELAIELGQSVVVDNRAGAGGAIGAASVARAAPDGYTLLMGSGSELVVLPAVKIKPPYEALKEFQPVAEVGTVSFMLVANPSVPASSVQELIALAKAEPGKLSYASFGIGSTNHLLGEFFMHKTGTDLLHVPYKGSAAAANDLVAGEVKLGFDTTTVMMPLVRGGKLKALALLSATRAGDAPDLPTMTESGVALATQGWLGVLAPRNTSPDIVDRLNSAINKVLGMASVKEILSERGFNVVMTTPAQFSELIKVETREWTEIARAAQVQVE
ncbi:Tripartite-type tricarboxylate transporter, receptor component TctC [Enhydrobacter aerosaccus]|uniref:Tripartite-type tricarboxylate transporter, receptor component TctC n=1 Tax=Enhydrobacter aerosaccus TaxID=225324 RepID=A0A1T4TN15_9HYPH|nr:tripartite tricarboxylate transporter substrate binding protein [Enhydrobacter aerosaccus]SKA41812.1 Tripartite-type tricarboxylate transporter, receptor component TctC [Enhydrobacter aerosaccus]